MEKELRLCLVLLALGALAGPPASAAEPVPGHEPIVGGPCEGCEAVFQGLPEHPPATARIAPPGEPGEAIRIEGRVLNADGSPAPGTIIYAYHTNTDGIYPPDPEYRGREAYRHGRLRGWAETDEDGRYRFDTVRPAGYPGSDTPRHVHMHVIEPGRCTYYIDSIVFRDDLRLTPERSAHYSRGRGGTGIVTPRRDKDGTWVVERDIILGENVPGYVACTARTEPAGGPTPPP